MRRLVAGVCCLMFGTGLMLPAIATGAPVFGERRWYPVGTSPVGVITGEFDGNPGLDLLTADEGNTATILSNLDGGVFIRARQVELDEQFIVTDVVRGRFNDDNIDDFAISADDLEAFPGFAGAALINRSRAQILRYDTDPITIGLFPSCITSDDFTGDGVLDLLSCTTTLGGQGSVSFLRANSNFTFGNPTEITLGEIIPSRLVAGNVDEDGFNDLVVIDTAGGAVWVLYGTSFTPQFGPPVLLASVSSPTAAAIVELTGDRLPAVAITNRIAGTVLSYRQTSPRTFAMPVSVQVGFAPVDLAAADFDGNDTQDLVVLNGGSSDVRLLLGDGQGNFQAGEAVGVGQGPVSIVVGDFNGDEKPDFATADQDDQFFGTNTQSVSVVLNGVSPPLTPTPTGTFTRTPTVTRTGTVTRTPTITQTPTRTLSGTPTITRTPTATPSQTVTPMPAGPGDANCDGRIDALDVGATVANIFELTCATADVDGDGEVRANDVTLVIQLILAQ